MFFIGVFTASGAESVVTTVSWHHSYISKENPGKVDQVKLAKVKVAYIVNFLKFTKWPDDAFEGEQSPIRVCILGKSLVSKYLETTLKTAKVHGRSVLLERMEIPRRSQFNSVELFESKMADFLVRLAHCHMIYITQDDTTAVNDLFNETDLRSTLVIADDPKVLTMGGHLAFLITDGHVSFSASVTNIQMTELKVSSKLLRLARNTK